MKGLAPDRPERLPHDVASKIEQTLRHYADLIGPWAETTARWLVADVARRNLNAWKTNSADMGRALRDELLNAPTGSYYALLMREQVDLIKSLPLDAAQRVHDLSQEALIKGERASTIAAKIMETGHVTASRAKLIARTEVSRTASTLTQARAQYAGSDGYIWRTSRDGDVRPTHRAQEGRYIRWSTPPKTDKGLAPYHAGCGPNCRCYPEPVFPNE